MGAGRLGFGDSMTRGSSARGVGSISVRKDLRDLDKLARKLAKQEMTKLRARVGREAVKVGRLALQRTGDPQMESPWPQRKRRADHPMLRKTGEMLRARIVRYKRKGDLELVVFFTAKKSFTSKRFWVHQKGNRRHSLPARRHIGFSRADLATIEQRVKTLVAEEMRG